MLKQKYICVTLHTTELHDGKNMSHFTFLKSNKHHHLTGSTNNMKKASKTSATATRKQLREEMRQPDAQRAGPY